MQMIADVKCYHCGHISGQVEGEREPEKRLILREFKPRSGYKGRRPKPGERIHCERCGGPVFLEDLRAVPVQPELMTMPQKKRARRSRPEAA